MAGGNPGPVDSPPVVDIKHTPHILHVHLPQFSEDVNTGVVNPRIYSAKSIYGQIRYSLERIIVGHISCDTLHFIPFTSQRSEEHTSELQSRGHLVCRLL